MIITNCMLIMILTTTSYLKVLRRHIIITTNICDVSTYIYIIIIRIYMIILYHDVQLLFIIIYLY